MRPIDERCINTIRMLSADAVEAARSGHPGLPMGAAPMVYTLWTRFLKHNPRNPAWPNRDRFIFSAGHGSMLLYSLLHLTGYDLSLDDLKSFRQWGSRTPGHPEVGVTPGVEVTTGPLGQGFANGVGMAIAQAHLAAKFNRPDFDIVDHYIYGFCSDGDLMEGISHEAASLAGHLKLGRIIYLYDDNRISIEGSTDLAFTEGRGERLSACGWHVQEVTDGNDLDAIEAALRAAQAETDRPSLIAVRTHIGFGSPNKQDSEKAHGEPLGAEELLLTKQNLNWPTEPSFFIPEGVVDEMRTAVDRGQAREDEWQERMDGYRKTHPDAAGALHRMMNLEFPEDWESRIPEFPPDLTGMPTRTASGKTLNVLASEIPSLMGGSADLGPSNKTLLEGESDFQAGNYGGRNLRFGVREHGMTAALNGMALYGGFIPYGGTFLIFSEYMRPAIRMAALMGLHVIYVFTHDSIGLGEDGPTHQPVEQLAGLRVIPNLTVIRPGDANETAQAWRIALRRSRGPVALVLTRQGVPTLDRTGCGSARDLEKGAYVLRDPDGKNPRMILIGCGSELNTVMAAADLLEQEEIPVRVVSMPSWELFDQQPEEYRRSVLPPTIPLRMAVEAGSPQGWHYYVGDRGKVLGIDRFGASAPYKVLFEKYGITAHHVYEEAMALYKRKNGIGL
jgi:transketolase